MANRVITEMAVDADLIVESCRKQTMRHIESVNEIIYWFAREVIQRGIEHDRSKLESPELEGFAFYGTEMANLEYGSETYWQNLSGLHEVLLHHYAANRHHPEHFENGISEMSLIDVAEMFCDWLASTRRNKDGNIYKSIEVGAKRFRLDPQLQQILVNTARAFDESGADAE